MSPSSIPASVALYRSDGGTFGSRAGFAERQGFASPHQVVKLAVPFFALLNLGSRHPCARRGMDSKHLSCSYTRRGGRARDMDNGRRNSLCILPGPAGPFSSFVCATGRGAQNPNRNSPGGSIYARAGITRSSWVMRRVAIARHPPRRRRRTHSRRSCCSAGSQHLYADVLIVGHHGSETSSAALSSARSGRVSMPSRRGPTRYVSKTLSDDVIVQEVRRGQVYRTDLNDVQCKTRRPRTVRPTATSRADATVSESPSRAQARYQHSM